MAEEHHMPMISCPKVWRSSRPLCSGAPPHPLKTRKLPLLFHLAVTDLVQTRTADVLTVRGNDIWPVRAWLRGNKPRPPMIPVSTPSPCSVSLR
jgi:hypothetical protein